MLVFALTRLDIICQLKAGINSSYLCENNHVWFTMLSHNFVTIPIPRCHEIQFSLSMIGGDFYSTKKCLHLLWFWSYDEEHLCSSRVSIPRKFWLEPCIEWSYKYKTFQFSPLHILFLHQGGCETQNDKEDVWLINQ